MGLGFSIYPATQNLAGDNQMSVELRETSQGPPQSKGSHGEVIQLLGKERCMEQGPSEMPSAGLPWWSGGWESACSCKELAFEPWSGRVSTCHRAKPARLEPMLCNELCHCGEKPEHHS